MNSSVAPNGPLKRSRPEVDTNASTAPGVPVSSGSGDRSTPLDAKRARLSASPINASTSATPPATSASTSTGLGDSNAMDATPSALNTSGPLVSPRNAPVSSGANPQSSFGDLGSLSSGNQLDLSTGLLPSSSFGDGGMSAFGLPWDAQVDEFGNPVDAAFFNDSHLGGGAPGFGDLGFDPSDLGGLDPSTTLLSSPRARALSFGDMGLASGGNSLPAFTHSLGNDGSASAAAASSSASALPAGSTAGSNSLAAPAGGDTATAGSMLSSASTGAPGTSHSGANLASSSAAQSASRSASSGAKSALPVVDLSDESDDLISNKASSASGSGSGSASSSSVAASAASASSSSDLASAPKRTPSIDLTSDQIDADYGGFGMGLSGAASGTLGGTTVHDETRAMDLNLASFTDDYATAGNGGFGTEPLLSSDGGAIDLTADTGPEVVPDPYAYTPAAVPDAAQTDVLYGSMQGYVHGQMKGVVLERENVQFRLDGQKIRVVNVGGTQLGYLDEISANCLIELLRHNYVRLDVTVRSMPLDGRMPINIKIHGLPGVQLQVETYMRARHPNYYSGMISAFATAAPVGGSYGGFGSRPASMWSLMHIS